MMPGKNIRRARIRVGDGSGRGNENSPEEVEGERADAESIRYPPVDPGFFGSHADSGGTGGRGKIEGERK